MRWLLTLLLTIIWSLAQSQMIISYGDARIINGGIAVDNSSLGYSGNIRWNGTNFQGFNGTTWVDLDKQGAPVGLIGDVQFSDGAGNFTNSDGLASGSTFNWNGEILDLRFGTFGRFKLQKNQMVFHTALGYFDLEPDQARFTMYLESDSINNAVFLNETGFQLFQGNNNSGSAGIFEINIGSGEEDFNLDVISSNSNRLLIDTEVGADRSILIELDRTGEANKSDNLLLDTNSFDISFNSAKRFEFDDSGQFKIDGYFMRYNESEGVFEFGTGIDEVIWQGALEDLTQVYNNKIDTIKNFRPVYFDNIVGDSIPTVNYAVASNIQKSINIAGVTTHDIPPNQWGFICKRGYVREVSYDDLTFDITRPGFLGDSIIIDSAPPFPSRVIILGAPICVDNDSGIFYVEISSTLEREFISGAESFTTQGIGAGTYYNYGFYDFSATDANLTQASPTVTWGLSGWAHQSHPFAVCGGTGSVTGGGRVALVAEGDIYNDFGQSLIGSIDTIITDIENVSLNEYYEATKFNSLVTYRLVVAEGAPTAYSLDFNYGFAKYDDSFNRDFYLVGIETTGLAAANDNGFNIELLHHTNTGWTYAATGFEAGNGVLTQFSDMSPNDELKNNRPFAWKSLNLGDFIEGSQSEGVVLRITTGANNSVQQMNTKIVIAVDRIPGFSEPN